MIITKYDIKNIARHKDFIDNTLSTSYIDRQQHWLNNPNNNGCLVTEPKWVNP